MQPGGVHLQPLSLPAESTFFRGLGIWRYRTETAAPPASGQVRFNNADPTLATELYLSETNDGGIDVEAFLDLLTDGALIYLQEASDSDNKLIIEISSNVDSGTYRTFGIENIILEGVEPSQNTEMICVVSLAGGGGGLVPASTLINSTLRGDGAGGWAEETSALISTSGFGTFEGGLAAHDTFDIIDGVTSIRTAVLAGVAVTTVAGLSQWLITPKVVNVGDIVQTERAAAAAPIAGLGQFWVRDDVPNVPMFTDDLGTDLQLGGGDVFKVGTPVDNQVGVWTGDGTLEGDANFIWDGVTLSIINVAGAAAVTVNANNPQVRFQENDNGNADEGNWRVIANNSRWRLQTVTDIAPTAGAATAFGIERTGTVVDSFDIDAPVFSNTGNVTIGTEALFAERGDHVFTPVGGRGILWVRNDTPNVLVFTDDEGTDWDLSVAAGDVFKVGTPVDEQFAIWTGDGTLASTPDISSDGVTMLLTPLIVRVTQFFRSRGFDDRATARRCLVFNNVTQWGPGDNDEYSFTRVLETGSMGAAGGSGKTGGGNFIFRGDAHATLPGDFTMRSGLGVWLNWDESAGITTFSTGIGNPKTLAMTIDASQNVDFEGTVTVDAEVQPVQKIIDIGDWNMDTTASLSVAHGLTLADIRWVQVTIRNDAGTLSTSFPTIDTTALSNERVEFDGTNVIMLRSLSGTFDGTDYDATSYNRGWITIGYVQ